MKLGTFILSLLQPALARILTALGFSVVSIVGMDAIFEQMKAQLAMNLSALPVAVLQLVLLAGGGTAIGIVLGAIATKLLLWKAQQATKILGVNPG